MARTLHCVPGSKRHCFIYDTMPGTKTPLGHFQDPEGKPLQEYPGFFPQDEARHILNKLTLKRYFSETEAARIKADINSLPPSLPFIVH
jgi:hypothetical protein